MNTCARPSAIVPRTALATHVGAGEEGVAVCHEVVSGTLRRRRYADALRRNLPKQLRDVCRLDFCAVRDCA
jgi:hypothetical protein